MKNIMTAYKKNAESILRLCNGCIGHLIPKCENGKIIECSFVRSANAAAKRRPFAWVGLDPNSGAVLYYKHCAYEDFMCTEKYPPTTVISGEYVTKRTVEQQQQYEKQLFDCYMKLRDFAFEKELGKEQRDIAKTFKEMWNITVLNDLKPYYQALSPEFFEWLSEVSD